MHAISTPADPPADLIHPARQHRRLAPPTLIVWLAVALAACATHAGLPHTSRIRVILDTDANNELDDQHAIAYLLFNDDVFEPEGITVNATKSGGNIDEQAAEAERIVRLSAAESRVAVIKGAQGSFETIAPHVMDARFDGSAAVDLIVRRARQAESRRLVLIAVGKLTNVALALKRDPSIASRMRVVWLGSNYPDPGEYNQDNDPAALDYLLDAAVEFEIVLVRYGKPSGTDAVRVTMDEIRQHMSGAGPRIAASVTGRNGGTFTTFGDYSVDLFEHSQKYGTPPSRALFDLAAVAIVKQPKWATRTTIPAPILTGGAWVERPSNPRRIALWHDFDRDHIVADLFESVTRPALVH
jgi:inosine-uridine nucleoside N-ribohydrolase